MPDIIHDNTLYEFKCMTPFHTSPLKGIGTQEHGGCPSEADGHFVAFGGTEEELRRKVLGVRARGLVGVGARGAVRDARGRRRAPPRRCP